MVQSDSGLVTKVCPISAPRREYTGIMKVEIEVIDYDPSRGTQMTWEEGYSIAASYDGGQIVLAANPAGLVSLARLLLTLAQDGVHSGHHWHLDQMLEEGSTELIVMRK
jgi:hypothetical protein